MALDRLYSISRSVVRPYYFLCHKTPFCIRCTPASYTPIHPLFAMATAKNRTHPLKRNTNEISEMSLFDLSASVRT